MKKNILSFLYNRSRHSSTPSVKYREIELQNYFDAFEKLKFQQDFLNANDLPKSALPIFSETKTLLVTKALSNIIIARIIFSFPKVFTFLNPNEAIKMLKSHPSLAEECFHHEKGVAFLSSLKPMDLFDCLHAHESTARLALKNPDILSRLGETLRLELIGSHLSTAEEYFNNLDETEIAFLNSGKANLLGLCQRHEKIALRVIDSEFAHKLTASELANLGKTFLVIKNRIFDTPAFHNKLSCSDLAKLCNDSEEFYTKLKNFPAEASNALSSFDALSLADLGKKLSSIAKNIISQPLLFKKLTPDTLSKLGYADEEIAIKIVRKEYLASQPRPNRLSMFSSDYEINNYNLISLAKKYFSVASYILDTPPLCAKLTEGNLECLKKTHANQPDFISKLETIISQRRNAPENRRPKRELFNFP